MMKLLFFGIFLVLAACNRQELPTHFSVPVTDGVFKTEDHRGQNIFLFFGFTQCPHVCPTTLNNLHRFVKALPENEKRLVEVVFVSVDFDRDNMQTLKKRLDGFPKNFHGGMDSPENLKMLLEKFGASFHVYKGKDPTDIIIDHTALIFVLNQKGEWVDSIKYDATAEDIRAAFDSIDQKKPVSIHYKQNQVMEVLGENKNCDLAQSTCEVAGYKMSLGPFPITSEKEFTVKVESKSPLGKPMEVDFEGVDLDMGLIRPKLTETRMESYSGKFEIPVCELPEMKWRARLILETPNGSKSLLYYFSSTKKGQ